MFLLFVSHIVFCFWKAGFCGVTFSKGDQKETSFGGSAVLLRYPMGYPCLFMQNTGGPHEHEDGFLYP